MSSKMLGLYVFAENGPATKNKINLCGVIRSLERCSCSSFFAIAFERQIIWQNVLVAIDSENN